MFRKKINAAKNISDYENWCKKLLAETARETQGVIC